jgi:hypothetical protein
MPFSFMSSISPTIAFSKDAFPNQRLTLVRRTKSIQPAKTSLVVLRDGFAEPAVA